DAELPLSKSCSFSSGVGDRIEFSFEGSFGALSSCRTDRSQIGPRGCGRANWRCASTEASRRASPKIFSERSSKVTRAMASAYFYDRKTALQYAMEMSPADFNFCAARARLSQGSKETLICDRN